jgi:hypothetical protein
MSNDKYPEVIEKCMETWKIKLEDYQFVKWDSTNFDYSKYPYTKEAMSCKKYAFVSDYIRLFALYNYGGIYLDSDIEVLKSFDTLLGSRAFTGFEGNDSIGVWLLASEKGNPFFKELLDCYDGRHFLNSNGEMDLTPNPTILAPVFEKHGIVLNNQFQQTKYITVYPSDYFCPLDKLTRDINITENSYAMHLFNGAWVPFEVQNYRRTFQRYYQELPHWIPSSTRLNMAKVRAALETGGLKSLFKRTSHFIKNLKG